MMKKSYQELHEKYYLMFFTILKNTNPSSEDEARLTIVKYIIDNKILELGNIMMNSNSNLSALIFNVYDTVRRVLLQENKQ